MLPDGTKSTTSRFLLCASTPPASTDSDQPSRQQYTGAPRCGRSISSVTALHRQSAKLYGTRSSRRYYARARTRGSSAAPVRAVPPSISRRRPREPCGSWREELCEGRFRRCCAVWSASFPPFSSCSFTQRSLLTLNTPGMDLDRCCLKLTLSSAKEALTALASLFVLQSVGFVLPLRDRKRDVGQRSKLCHFFSRCTQIHLKFWP